MRLAHLHLPILSNFAEKEQGAKKYTGDHLNPALSISGAFLTQNPGGNLCRFLGAGLDRHLPLLPVTLEKMVKLVEGRG